MLSTHPIAIKYREIFELVNLLINFIQAGLLLSYTKKCLLVVVTSKAPLSTFGFNYNGNVRVFVRDIDRFDKLMTKLWCVYITGCTSLYLFSGERCLSGVRLQFFHSIKGILKVLV